MLVLVRVFRSALCLAVAGVERSALAADKPTLGQEVGMYATNPIHLQSLERWIRVGSYHPKQCFDDESRQKEEQPRTRLHSQVSGFSIPERVYVDDRSSSLARRYLHFDPGART